MAENRRRELKPAELITETDPKLLDFKTTEDISLEKEIIGQERALKAIDFGLNIKNDGFNLYLSGHPGTGRNTTISQLVENIAKNEPAPNDICYLYNFEKIDEPKVLLLPAGKGCNLKKDMDEFTKELETEIIQKFASEDYEKSRKEIIGRFEKQKDEQYLELENYAKSKGFGLEQSLTGLVVIPVVDGRAISDEEYGKLPEERKKQIKNDQEEIYERIFNFLRKIRDLQKETRKNIQELDKRIALNMIGHLIDDLKKKYEKYEVVKKHLEDVQEDIIKNLDDFKKEEEPRELPFMQPRMAKEQITSKYKINLLVDNCNTKGAPVIKEFNPTYYNLMGKVEYRAQFGILTTDFMMIKPGSAHKANGGYLIVQALDLLINPFAWDFLKKVIKHKLIKIEEISERYGFASTAGLKPQPVPVKLKVILVGNPYIYSLLYAYDEEFSTLFKVKADFDHSITKSGDIVRQYAHFIAAKCREEKLLAFKNDAVAKIIDYGSRLMSHKGKLTARFLEIIDIMRESEYWAKKHNSKIVEAAHVKKALEEKVFRSNMIDSKISEMIQENTIFIDTDGSVMGQINGLSVMDIGDYMFGKPSRITARTFIGKGDIINIERETKMSGKIHSKGVLILGGYLGSKFAQDKPLALSASICFEQLYEGVEGDSASSTELYCLLSSLSCLPLRQDIAVTGSVNQNGDIQPIGGVNEKIEGFYGVCKVRGLTGKQGVMIPEENVKHLMLKDEVIEAVKSGKFHIYTVSTIDEGIEILTGLPAGGKKNGGFPKGTVNYLVNEKLRNYAETIVKFGKKK